MRAVLKGLLVVFLAWRGGASLVALVGQSLEVRPRDLAQALTLDEAGRIRRELARQERQAGLEPGREHRLYRALRRFVPEDGEVHFVAERELKQALAFSHMQVLLYPRRFHHHRAIPDDWRAVLKLDERFYLLEYEWPPHGGLDDDFELLAQGADFRLWHYTGEPR